MTEHCLVVMLIHIKFTCMWIWPLNGRCFHNRFYSSSLGWCCICFCFSFVLENLANWDLLVLLFRMHLAKNFLCSSLEGVLTPSAPHQISSMQEQKSGKKLDGQWDFHKLFSQFGQINDCRRKEDCIDSGKLSS